MKISIVICTLSNYTGLEKVLESINKQKILPWEIIVVHGDINDETKRICNEWNNKGLTVIYLKAERSLVIQRNIGINKSTGDIICFFDDDIILDNDYFEGIVKAYKSNEAIGGVQGTITNLSNLKFSRILLSKIFLLEEIYGNGKIKRSGTPSFHKPINEIAEVQVFNGCQMTFRADIIKKIKFDSWYNDYWYGDDFETSFAVSKVYKLLQIPDSRLIHEGNASSERSPKIAFMVGLNYRYIREKYNLYKGFGKIICMWSDIGRILLYIGYMLSKGDGTYLNKWIKGNLKYSKLKKLNNFKN